MKTPLIDLMAQSDHQYCFLSIGQNKHIGKIVIEIIDAFLVINMSSIRQNLMLNFINILSSVILKITEMIYFRMK